ncbi:hypothetical protein IFM89_037473 [Coptis chinensis]|uniref:Uncharacterized protein n=1 Tax=Coptis chinensis TaxID=261450 RepID=A0A835HMR4_9MAGN|nr:hypothetical protein IFM89_037473 [Coptis chinensis]
MGKSRLYRNGAHDNEEEENKKKMKKGKNIDDRDLFFFLSSRGKKREKERADFKQILGDKGEEMYMKMKQRGKGVDNGENHETLADMKRKLEKKGVACLGSHSILSQPNEAEAESSKSASKRVKKERHAILAALFGHSDGGVHISNPRNDVFTSDQNIRPTERISNHRLNDETHQGDSFESGLNPSTKGLTKNSTKRGPAQKFVVPESARHITMRELGYLWRSSKSRFSRIIASCANEEERMEKRPKNIKLEWWKSFVRKRLSKEFQEKIQESRETQAESSSLSLQDDAISQLFGPECHGRMRGYGFGVCPSML